MIPFIPNGKQARFLELLSHGLSNKQVAAEIERSLPDVEYHLTKLFRLTGTRNRVELVMWWQRFRQQSPYRRRGLC